MSNRDFTESNEYYVYILSNTSGSTLYIGITNNLKRRLYEHRSGLIPGFTERYNVHKLIYYETTSDVESAILREKQLKRLAAIKKGDAHRLYEPRASRLVGRLGLTSLLSF